MIHARNHGAVSPAPQASGLISMHRVLCLANSSGKMLRCAMQVARSFADSAGSAFSSQLCPVQDPVGMHVKDLRLRGFTLSAQMPQEATAFKDLSPATTAGESGSSWHWHISGSG